MEGFVHNSNSFQHLPQTTRSTPNLLRHPGQTWRISLSDLVSSTNLTFWLLSGKKKTATQYWLLRGEKWGAKGRIWWRVAILERKLMNITSNLSAPFRFPHPRKRSKISGVQELGCFLTQLWNYGVPPPLPTCHNSLFACKTTSPWSLLTYRYSHHFCPNNFLLVSVMNKKLLLAILIQS